MKLKKIIAGLILAGIVACSGDSDTPAPPPVEVKNPAKAQLLHPENNSDCFTGTVVSETETEVQFQWEASENTNSYVLEVKELETGVNRVINTVSTSQKIRVKRGTAYSWFVTSKGSGSSQSAKSDVWRFYNVGEPKSSYPPFPAEAIAPASGANVEPGTVTLEWEASDIDGDIQNYTVLFEMTNPPTAVQAQTSATSVNVNVTSGNVYYWQIITVDKEGNSSYSQVFPFSVN